MHSVFFYGTLKSKGYANNLVKRQKLLGEAVTKPIYKLYHLRGFPGLAPEENSFGIKGEVWEVDDECLKRLDSYEGHPTLFKRGTVEIENFENVQGYFYQGSFSGGINVGDTWTEEIAEAAERERR